MKGRNKILKREENRGVYGNKRKIKALRNRSEGEGDRWEGEGEGRVKAKKQIWEM